ncbi:hypothetical protein ASC77_05930 [Nocardioides sp. Root1257]|uniref:bifunctional PIG-L family deacetylase/class I SAM-dependent methyltransferase n=1 Tax=unclassified Nocardioides TaxID=2615069 RepID=UPI0006F6E5E5|nr:MULTISPECIES: bifunctional PIG-L family deacetylase/class I SAM-dependent methyltransferase [unclassified Nocardioides]KQW53786.1 hypothetical protein ASC77_05930 [Nocardioides sp. Root1257]KRC56472.1 hypothetical protein ASE24_05930 [Nocardioides sp. Root224]
MVAAEFRHDEPGTAQTVWAADPTWATVPPVEIDPQLQRIVVLAAHPDDESLGAAGLLGTAARLGLEVELVLATAGERSHPHSPTLPPDRLARARLAESRAALAEVAAGSATTYLRVPDGQVAAFEEHLVDVLVRILGDGRHTLLLSPWRHDGHPDHEACGRAAAVAAHRSGAELLQYPLWFWHWATPEQMPWSRVRRLALSPSIASAKRAAIGSHRTQVRPLSPVAGDEQLLRDDFLEHFLTPSETYLDERADDPALDDLHRREADPWGVDSRWYEQRKRALTVAALPRPIYGRTLEIGCSTGALAADLAERSRDLLAVDASPAAVAAATQRLGARPGVAVERRDLPGDWPPGEFDLVVLSEVGYFLSPADLDDLVARIDDALGPDGDLVLCHWRHRVEGWPLDGPAVHDRFRSRLSRPEVGTYRERDFELTVFSRSPLPEAEAGV